MDLLTASGSWAQLINAFLINILLSVDNAVVIALAVRALAPRQQRAAMLLGAVGVLAVRLATTLGFDVVLALPLFKLAAALFIAWVGVKLIAPGTHHPASAAPLAGIKRGNGLWAALGTIWLAEPFMSVDNVLGVYAAAGGSWPHIIAALLLSVPLVIYGSQLVLAIMQRLPVIITLGGGLLGFVAGKMLAQEQTLRPFLETRASRTMCQALLDQAQPLQQCLAHALSRYQIVAAALGALVVMALGVWRAKQGQAALSRDSR